jgi:biopolymer transport protein ExbB/TolQ
MFEGNSLWQLIAQTDAISKAVLLLLFAMSVICWAIFFCKVALARIKNRDMKNALDHIKRMRTLDEIAAFAAQRADTLPGYFLLYNIKFLKSVALEDMNSAVDVTYSIDRVQYHVDQSVDAIVTQEESYLSFLTSSAVVSPLLGLFGTIWGLIHAFMGIAQSQVADISSVAPGIAEALTTTLAGLLVAIPALMMVNYLIASVRSIEKQCMQLGDCVRMHAHTILIKKRDVCVDFTANGHNAFQP